MNRCAIGLFKKQILRSATGAELSFGIMTSSDEDSNKASQVGTVGTLAATAAATKPGTGVGKTAGASSPQEIIQHYKPQAGVGNAARLPDKIMAILMSEEAPDAIWWLQKGTAFAMQKEKFQEEVLDKHFRGNKFKSLVRNLHRWGFKRMTCDTSPAGKTIAFSHKYFRQDKPELVQLIQITKDSKDIGDAIRDRRQALHGALPTATAPPRALRLPGPSAGPLREEGTRFAHDNRAGLLASASAVHPPLTRGQPSLANMVAEEHLQNLASQEKSSLLNSLTTEWQRSNQDQSPLQLPLQPSLGVATGRGPQLDLAGTGFRGAALDHRPVRDNSDLLSLDQMRPSVYDAQRMQRLGSLLQAEGESLENALHSAALHQQRRDNLLQHRLAAASAVNPAADAHNRLLLQQQLGGAAAVASPSGLLPQLPQMNPSYLSQLASSNTGGNVVGAPMGSTLQQGVAGPGGWNLEQLLARRNMGSLHQQGSGRSMDGSQRSSQQDAGSGLTPEELRYIAELRRRGP